MKIHSSFTFPQAVPEVYDFLSLDEPEQWFIVYFSYTHPYSFDVVMWITIMSNFCGFEVSTLEVLYICIGVIEWIIVL